MATSLKDTRNLIITSQYGVRILSRMNISRFHPSQHTVRVRSDSSSSYDKVVRIVRLCNTASHLQIRHLLRSRNIEQWLRSDLLKGFEVQVMKNCCAINIEQMENLRLIICLDLRDQHERRARLVSAEKFT